MYEVTYSKFLGHFYAEIVAECCSFREDIEILREALGQSEETEKEPNLSLAEEIVLDDLITRKSVDLETLENARDSLEDILNGRVGSRVERLMMSYFEKIKERYKVESEENRIEMRILDAEIDDIERNLEKEGFPVFGGYVIYESMMVEEEEEQVQFEFDIPTK